jgi:hypothetical protein
MITDGKLLVGASCSPDSWNGNTLLVGRIVELFYADEVDDPHSVELALSICEGCPVVDRCLDAGIDESMGCGVGLLLRSGSLFGRDAVRLSVGHECRTGADADADADADAVCVNGRLYDHQVRVERVSCTCSCHIKGKKRQAL